ncbi:MAG: M1 family metallopeptidase [Bacteroidia bacterium]|nr:M1 family metallopeptidase [Bacteroidia bacterium]
MKKTLLIIFSLMFITSASNAQIINKEPLSQRITGYRIDAKLDPVKKTVTGSMDAFWVNKTADTVNDIQLHLYMNAFRSSKSTFYMGSYQVKDTTIYGRIDISSFTLADGTDLIPLIQYIRPDDGNPNDSTVVKIILPEAAEPGDTVSITVNFMVKLPGKIRRTGYNDDYFFVGQWFPKFGVYEPAGMRYRAAGGWNCHQFHPNSEFYANHSVYDVILTVPDEYIVGSGGMLISEADCGDDNSYKTLTYRAEDIVDFAWTAWPGYAVFTDQWRHVKITLLLPEDRKEQVARQFTAVKNTLEYLTGNVGTYPWPHLTFVDPPAKGSGASGMEYTTIFTSMSSYKMPGFIHFPEMVTVHEFGHAYFMGILATNEFEDPWMDEGINSFWEARIMDHYWGENSGMIDHPLFKMADKTSARSSYVYSPNRQVVSNKENSWNYPLGTYSMMSYMKTSTWLYTLMGIIGEETTNDVFREYYKRWAFKHPAPKDFIDVVNDVVKKNYGDKFGPDINWFFDETLYGTGICDYKVAAFNNIRQDTAKVRKNEADTLLRIKPSTDSLYKCSVGLDRLGEVMLPVEVLIHFSDGHETLSNWDGKDRFKKIEVLSNSEIQWVKIDPEYKIRMDVNFINNSLTYEPDRVPVKRITNKFISFLQFFVSSVTL